jgi:hypothetical protein
MAFKLTQDQNFNWQGKVGDQVTIKVVPKGTTLTVTPADVFYPSDTSVPINADSAKFNLVAGPKDLSVTIKPKAVPPIIWSVVEVGTDGSQQALATVNDPVPQGDPYSTGVRITGQAA